MNKNIISAIIFVIAFIMVQFIPLFIYNEYLLGLYIITYVLLFIISFALVFNNNYEDFILSIILIGAITYFSLNIKNEIIKENNKLYKVRYIKTFLIDYKLVFKKEIEIKEIEK